jgi:hypothetical protein
MSRIKLLDCPIVHGFSLQSNEEMSENCAKANFSGGRNLAEIKARDELCASFVPG